MKAWAWGLAAGLLLLQGPTQAEPKATPVTEVALARALHGAHQDVFKKTLNGHRLAVAWAQTALETGRGARLKGYNVGNVDNGQASYKSLREGAKAYWKALEKCKSAFAYFDVGDAHGAAMQLGRCGYYRADPAGYAKGMTSLRQTFSKEVWPKLRGRLRGL